MVDQVMPVVISVLSNVFLIIGLVITFLMNGVHLLQIGFFIFLALFSIKFSNYCKALGVDAEQMYNEKLFLDSLYKIMIIICSAVMAYHISPWWGDLLIFDPAVAIILSIICLIFFTSNRYELNN
jgi:hypothetical protein